MRPFALLVLLFWVTRASAQNQVLDFSDATDTQTVTVAGASGLIDSQTNLTIEFWVYNLGNNNIDIVSGNFSHYLGYSSVPDEMLFNWGTDCGLTGSLAYPHGDNTWHHFAIAIGGGTGQMYFDGSALTMTDNTCTALDAVNGDLKIGRGDFGGDVQGRLDDVAIWQITRSAMEIQTSANDGVGYAPTASGLVAYWQFEGAGQTVVDAAGSNDGVLGSNATVEAIDPARITDATTPVPVELLQFDVE